MTQRFDANTHPLDPGLRLLEASAGTGKTFALAHLCLRLITERGIPLQAVLVVTFTEAAAAELRSRIGARLQLALQGLDALQQNTSLPETDQVLIAWWDRAPSGAERSVWISRLLVALEQLDAADITTIHGFCSRSLRRMALSSGAAMQPLIETDATVLLQEVVQEVWQEQMLTLPVAQLQGLDQAGLSADGLREALARLDGDPHPTLEMPTGALDPDQPLSVQLQGLINAAWQRFLTLWSRDGRTLESCFRAAAEQWKALGFKSSPYSAKPRTDRCAQVDRWISTLSEAPDLSVIRAFEKPLREYFHPGSWCKVARRCGEDNPSLAAAELQSAIADLWDGPPEHVWRYLLQRCLRSLAERRQRSGSISFAGLLAAMDPGEVADASWLAPLRERFRAVMVDEFQDTDPVQWRLLRRAFAQGSDRHLLLLVGDPKQAIYRFRGGDLDTYKVARSQVDRIDHLLDNHRTTAPLMAGLNALMEPGLPRSELPVPAVAARSRCDPPALPDGVHPLQLLTLAAQAGGSASAAPSRTAIDEQLPAAVAEAVINLLRQRSELTPSDLCILVNRHDQASALRRALGSRGVPTRLVAQGDVFESDAAQLLQHFLDALAAPGHDRPLRLLAASPLLGWRPVDLLHAGEDQRLDQLAQRLRLLSVQLPRLGLLGCLSELLAVQQMADLSEQGRLLGDLQQAARLVQEEMHRQGLDAASAAQWLRRQRLHPSDPVPTAREPHSDLAEQAVAVVTVHRSKGLEFPVVICPYLWRGAKEARFVKGPLWRERAEGGWHLALDRDWGLGYRLWQLSHAEQVAEAERLAYVAVTRARSQLLLVWARCSGQQSVLEDWLFAASPDGGVLRELPLTQMVLPTEPTQDVWRAPVHQESLALGKVPERIDRSWGRSSYSAWIASPASEASLEQGRDRDPDGEESSTSGDLSWAVQGPLAEFPRGAAAGDCLHRMLEQLPFQPAPEVAQVIEAELLRAGLDIAWRPAVELGFQQMLATPLGGPLGEFSLGMLPPERRLHELNFDLPVQRASTADLLEAFRLDPEARFGADYRERLQRLQVSSRGFLTGSIDLVFSDHPDPQQARWWVVDWKSNWIGERDHEGRTKLCGPRHYDQGAMEIQMLEHHYPLQAHLYLVALHRHLQWRLPDYSPQRHLGGYVYVFLRGMPGPEGFRLRDAGPGRIVEPAPLQRVEALDRMLRVQEQ